VFVLMTTEVAQAMRRARRALRFLLILEGQPDLRAIDELAVIPDSGSGVAQPQTEQLLIEDLAARGREVYCRTTLIGLAVTPIHTTAAVRRSDGHMARSPSGTDGRGTRPYRKRPKSACGRGRGFVARSAPQVLSVNEWCS